MVVLHTVLAGGMLTCGAVSAVNDYRLLVGCDLAYAARSALNSARRAAVAQIGLAVAVIALILVLIAIFQPLNIAHYALLAGGVLAQAVHLGMTLAIASNIRDALKRS